MVRLAAWGACLLAGVLASADSGAQDPRAAMKGAQKLNACMSAEIDLRNSKSAAEAQAVLQKALAACPERSQAFLALYSNHVSQEQASRAVAGEARPGMVEGVGGYTDPGACADRAARRDGSLYQAWSQIQPALGQVRPLREKLVEIRSGVMRERQRVELEGLRKFVIAPLEITFNLVKNLSGVGQATSLAQFSRALVAELARTRQLITNRDELIKELEKTTQVILENGTEMMKTANFLYALGKDTQWLMAEIRQYESGASELRAKLAWLDASIDHYQRLDTAVTRAFALLEGEKAQIDGTCGIVSASRKQTPVNPMADCSILTNVDESRRLSQSNMDAWLALSSRCGK